MAFSSKLYPGELIVDHSTNSDVTHVNEYGRGYDSEKSLFGKFGSPASAFPRELLLSDNDIMSIVQETEERGSRLSDLILQANLVSKDQKQTNYCWANAPAHCLEIERMLQGQEYVDLSAASVAAPINNYRNQGGAGTDAIKYMSDIGIAPVSMWPTNAIDRRYYTQAMLERSKLYRTTEWWELRTLQEKFSYLALRRGATSVGYPWWSHEVSSIEPVVLDGELASRDRNNWGMGYSYKGFMIIRGSRMNFDECIAPAVMVAS